MKIYQRAVKTAKINSWRKFVEEESQKDAWGIVYRLMNKKLTPREAATAISKENHHTTSWRETANAILDAFVIPDIHEDDSPQQTDIRNRNSHHITYSEPLYDLTMAQIGQIVKERKNKKTPGIDLIEVEIFKATWPVMGEVYTNLYKACLRTGTFPNNRKKGRLHAVLKPGKRNPTSLTAYRPICLLPIPAKVLETLILQQLNEHITELKNTSDIMKHQFEFERGKSTTDAINKLILTTERTTDKYVMGIFVDIRGAFDHIWWPDFLDALRTNNTPAGIYNIIHSYLSHREVLIQEGSITI